MVEKQEKSLLAQYGFSKADEKKYPVVTRILKQLTPERIEKEIKEIQKIKLPPELQKWVKEYEKVGERDEFLWRWMYKAVQIVTAPIVSEKYQKPLWEVKTLIIVFVTLLDDIADKSNNEILLNELLKIPIAQKNINIKNLNKIEIQYIKSTIKLWNYIEKRIKKYPKYKEFKEIFEYDIIQVLNEMKYAQLVNRNLYLINKTEYWLYLPYNMQGLVSYTVDLMCSFNFFIKNISAIREIAWFLQKMAKIANWVVTWEREIEENDFTSGVFAYAIDSKIVTMDEFTPANSSKIIQRIKKAKIEKELFSEWEKSYHIIKRLNGQIEKRDKKQILLGSEKFLAFHLVSRGYI